MAPEPRNPAMFARKSSSCSLGNGKSEMLQVSGDRLVPKVPFELLVGLCIAHPFLTLSTTMESSKKRRKKSDSVSAAVTWLPNFFFLTDSESPRGFGVNVHM